MTMSGPSAPFPPPTSSSAGRPAKEQALPPQFTVIAAAKVSGRTCCISAFAAGQPGLSWSTRRETRHGKPKSLAVFPMLAATSPDLNLALAILVRLIFEGESSWLPAPACRDWRSPGSRSHARLTKPRGQQMPEVIGTRISSQLYAWMLGLPANRLPRLAARGSIE